MPRKQNDKRSADSTKKSKKSKSKSDSCKSKSKSEVCPKPIHAKAKAEVDVDICPTVECPQKQRRCASFDVALKVKAAKPRVCVRPLPPKKDKCGDEECRWRFDLEVDLEAETRIINACPFPTACFDVDSVIRTQKRCKPNKCD